MVQVPIGAINWFAGSTNRHHYLPNGKYDGTQKDLVVTFSPEYRRYTLQRLDDEPIVIEPGVIELTTTMSREDFNSPVLLGRMIQSWLPVIASEFASRNWELQGVNTSAIRAGWRALATHFVGRAVSSSSEEIPESIDENFDVGLSSSDLELLESRRVQEEADVKLAKAREREEASERKAIELLQEVLTEEEFSGYRENGFVDIHGGLKGDKEKPILYRIFSLGYRMIEIFSVPQKTPWPIFSLCVEFQQYGLPNTDSVVMKCLLAKADEKQLWNVGNVFRGKSFSEVSESELAEVA